MLCYGHCRNICSSFIWCLSGGIGGSDSEAASVWMAVVQVRGEERRGGEERRERAAVQCKLTVLLGNSVMYE